MYHELLGQVSAILLTVPLIATAILETDSQAADSWTIIIL